VPSPDWREPVRLLEAETGDPATGQQRALAAMTGLALAGSEPRGVVAVMLEEHLRPTIWGVQPERATDRQRNLLSSFGVADAADALLSRRVASAWISHHFAVRTLEHLRRLVLERGDAVIKRSRSRSAADGKLYEHVEYGVVSSIGANGRVYFRGGGGRSAWPSSLERAPATSRPEDYPQFREATDDPA
jgi:hypothetical protein